ncbi:MAG: DUF2442 domain-containing protein [bacterium]|nr:DUF2442 domain-containing protein [bacterium]
MHKPIEVRALPGYKIWLRYDDGAQGEVDLSEYAGKGVFVLWNDYKAFEKVYIGEADQIAWSEEIDMCPDSMYMKLTGKKAEDVFPNLKEVQVNA